MQSECYRQAFKSLALDFAPFASAIPISLRVTFYEVAPLCHMKNAAAGFLFGVSMLLAARESVASDSIRPTASENSWTIMLMAPDGSWGVATQTYIYQAIAAAMASCKKMSQAKLGCGAQMQAAQSRWIIAIRCDQTNIITTGERLVDAVAAAIDRSVASRSKSERLERPCEHIVTVDPRGVVFRNNQNEPWDGALLSKSE